MYLPNNRCDLYSRSPAPDRRGEYSFGAPSNVPCSLIEMALKVEKTSVRADSSGSRGKALEEQGVGRMLFPIYIAIEEGDIVHVDGEYMEVVGVFPRRDVLGKLDHKDVSLIMSQAPQ